jgi:hypothetical protein
VSLFEIVPIEDIMCKRCTTTVNLNDRSTLILKFKFLIRVDGLLPFLKRFFTAQTSGYFSARSACTN